MWRIFRLGVKGCYGPTQGQIRVVSTTSLSSDAENCDDESDVFGNLADNASINKFSSNSIVKNKILIHDSDFDSREKLLNVDKLLKEVNWKDYLVKRDINSLKVDKDETSEDESVVHKLKATSHEFIHEKLDDASVPLKVVKDLEQKKNDARLFEPDFESDENVADELFGKKLLPQRYGKKMLALCKEKKLSEALDVLEKEMVAQKVTPNRYCYNILINACGKAGYTLKAFRLYGEMKKRGTVVEEYVYTGLFNACANSPDLADGLERATVLRKRLKDNHVLLNPINYRAMIKAFGRCGDIATGFELADEMIDVGHNVTTQAMNFLLQACITDKESGFRHAIMVWRKMRSLRLTPDIYSYTLLMRCVKECKAGDVELLSQLLERPKKFKDNEEFAQKKEAERLQRNKPQELLSTEDVNSWLKESEGTKTSVGDLYKENTAVTSIGVIPESKIEVVEKDPKKKFDSLLPNVLSSYYMPGKIHGISSLETSGERFVFLGGPQGVLHNMKLDHVKPEMAIFTFMLESLPNDREAEEALLSTMESIGMEFNVIFLNMLLKRRNYMHRYKEAREALTLMQTHRVHPNLVTFYCLGSGCVCIPQAYGLLKDMEDAGYRVDEIMMRTLINTSIWQKDYAYTLEMLWKMKQLKIVPREGLLKDLEKARKKIRAEVLEKEREHRNQKTITERDRVMLDAMRVFMLEYGNWLKKSDVELIDHPWAQYGFDESKERSIVKSD